MAESLITQIHNLCLEGLETDGAHHKQWYLEQILKIISPGINIDELDCEKGIAP